MDLRRKGHGSQSTMSRCVKAATKLRLEHASPRLSEQGCGEQKKCRKGPARDSPRISAYPTAGKTNSPRLIPAASNPLPPTSSYSDQKKSPPKDFCPLTNPQPYQREEAQPPLSGFQPSIPAGAQSGLLTRLSVSEIAFESSSLVAAAHGNDLPRMALAKASLVPKAVLTNPSLPKLVSMLPLG